MRFTNISLTNGVETHPDLDYYPSFSEKQAFISERVALIDTIIQRHRKGYGGHRLYLLLIIVPAIFISLGAPLWLFLRTESRAAAEEQVVTIQQAGPDNCLVRLFCATWENFIIFAFGLLMMSGVAISWTTVRGEKKLRDTIKATLQMFNENDNRREINWLLLDTYESQEHPCHSKLQEIIIFEYGRLIPEILAIGIQKHPGDTTSPSTGNGRSPTSAPSEYLENV